jgi:hypothetical protein
MSSNRALLKKADLVIQDLRNDGGILQPTEGASFIRKLIVQPTILRQARVIEMTSPERRINKIGFGKRILRKATSGVALPAEQRAKPTTEQLTLRTNEQIAEVRLPYDVVEDNIERATAANNEASNTGPGGLRQTIIDMIAERAATDIEEYALHADTNYTNPNDPVDTAFLSQDDGWMKRASTVGNVVDVQGAPISKEVFKKGVKQLPIQYFRNRGAMRHFVSNNQEIEYRDTLANRATALGDTMTTGEQQAWAYGTPVTPVNQMIESEGLFTDPANLVFGIQRQVSMEFDKDITARVYIIVLTCRIGLQIEEGEALVKYENIAA